MIAAILCLAAPLPYSPQGAAEVVFDAKTPARANALLQSIRSPDFAARLKADARLKALLPRVQVVLSSDATHQKVSIAGCEERQALALLRAIEKAVTTPADRAETEKLLASQRTAYPYEGEFRFRGGLRRGWKDYGGDYPIIDPATLEIRFDPPAVKTPTRRTLP